VFRITLLGVQGNVVKVRNGAHTFHPPCLLGADQPTLGGHFIRYEDAVVRLEKARATERELESVMAVRMQLRRDAKAQSLARIACFSSGATRATSPLGMVHLVMTGACHLVLQYLQEAAKAAALADAAAQASARVQAGQLMADAEVAAAEKLLRVAQIEHNLAEGEKARARGVAYSVMDRAESGKAAMVAVAGGLAAAVPLALAAADSAGGSASELLSFADVVCCSALFGVTYRCVHEDNHILRKCEQATHIFVLVLCLAILCLTQLIVVSTHHECAVPEQHNPQLSLSTCLAGTLAQVYRTRRRPQ
jgi:hypothetical protein